MGPISITRNSAALVFTTILVFGTNSLAAVKSKGGLRLVRRNFILIPHKVSCELALFSQAKMLIVAKALHQALLRKEFSVTYLAFDPVLLKPLGLQSLAEVDTRHLRMTFTEKNDHYILSFSQIDAVIHFSIPPVVAWENLEISKAGLDRILTQYPHATADLNYAHAFGTILNPKHRFRPYMQVHSLLRSDLLGQRVSLGFYASCNSALAKAYRNSVVSVRTILGWRCYIPVIEAQASI